MSKVWRNQGRAGSAVEAWAGGVSARARIDGGLVLPGTSGNYAFSPDSAALSVTGDIDIKVKVAMTDWTPSAVQTLVAKAQTTSLRSYYLQVNTDGTLVLTTSNNGSATVTGTSTVATGVTDGATKWVRATLDVANSTNRVYKFYTSDDGVSWSQLGTTVTTAGTTSIHDNVSSLEIGSITIGTANLLDGTVYRTIIQSAYDTADNTTSLVFDANFESQPEYTLSFTESSSNAAVVTVNPGGTSNDPTLLEPQLSGYHYQPGGVNSSNYAWIPDDGTRFTGDLSIAVRVDIEQVLAATPALVVKAQSGVDSNIGPFYFNIGDDRRMNFFFVDSNGTNRFIYGSSAFYPRNSKWFGVQHDADNGAGGSVTTFFYSLDETNPSWTTLQTVTSAFSGTKRSNNAQIGVAGTNLGVHGIVGKYYRAMLWDSLTFSGTPTVDINFDAITSHSQTTFTAGSGETVTLARMNSGRKACWVPSIAKGGKRVWLFGTDDFLESPDNPALDIGTSESATMMVVHRHWNNFGTNDTLLAKKANTTNTTQGYFMGSGSSTAAQTQGQMGDGTAGATATQTTSRTAGALSTSFLVRNVAADTLTLYLNGVAGTPVTDATTTTLANSEAFRIGRLSGAGTEYLDAEIYAVGLWKRALTATEISALHNFYVGRIP